MLMIDIEKRNLVLRKYCPYLFKDKHPKSKSPDTRLRYGSESGDYIDAITYGLDDDGELNEVWMVSSNDLGEYDAKLSIIDVNHPAVCEWIHSLIEDPPDTDTIIIDQSAIHKTIGSNQLVAATLIEDIETFRDMTQDEIVREFVRLYGTNQSGAQRVETLSLEEFFDGNGDDSSIAPNTVGCGHPGIDVFREVLYAVRSRPEVIDVRIGVHEWPYPDEEDVWISGGQIFFWVRGVTTDEVFAWIDPLHPESVDEVGETFEPVGGPDIESGVKVFWTTWD